MSVARMEGNLAATHNRISGRDPAALRAFLLDAVAGAGIGGLDSKRLLDVITSFLSGDLKLVVEVMLRHGAKESDVFSLLLAIAEPKKGDNQKKSDSGSAGEALATYTTFKPDPTDTVRDVTE